MQMPAASEADDVARDHVTSGGCSRSARLKRSRQGCAAEELDAVNTVGRDDVPLLRGRGPADGIGGGVVDVDAVLEVRIGVVAGRVSTDEVAGDRGSDRSARPDPYQCRSRLR